MYEEAIRAYILSNGSTFEMPQLVLLEPWIQSAASYGLLGDKQHRAAQAKGDQMVFLRDLGIVVEDECVGDTTASVPGKCTALITLSRRTGPSGRQAGSRPVVA